MVWALFPIDPVSGEDKYYIFARGTYKVGRKGAHITRRLAQECTHVIVDQLRPVKEDVLDAIVSKNLLFLVVGN